MARGNAITSVTSGQLQIARSNMRLYNAMPPRPPKASGTSASTRYAIVVTHRAKLSADNLDFGQREDELGASLPRAERILPGNAKEVRGNNLDSWPGILPRIRSEFRCRSCGPQP